MPTGVTMSSAAEGVCTGCWKGIRVKLLPQLGLVFILFAPAGLAAPPVEVAPAPRRVNARELEKLRGEWTLVKSVQPNGTVEKFGPEYSIIGHRTLTFDGGKVVIEEDYTDPPYTTDATIALNVDVEPKQIDLTVTDVNSDVDRKFIGKSRLGVYELDGDRLKLCLTDYGVAQRPTGFEHGKGREVYEFVRMERGVVYSVLKDWYEARVKEPAIVVLKDEAAYTKLFNESFAAFRFPKPVAEKVDFKVKQVVAVCWGGKGSTGYNISVVSVTGNPKETTITVKTTAPKGLANPAETYPALVLEMLRTESVKVVVTGDRLPTGWSDFTDLKRGLEVNVK